MQALFYENLIRGVYNSGRTSTNGADADIYRQMDRAFRDLEIKSMFFSQDEREIEFQNAFGAVRLNIRKALKNGLPQIRHLASKEEIRDVENAEKLLSPRFWDKEKLDEIIDRSVDIFTKYGLKN